MVRNFKNKGAFLILFLGAMSCGKKILPSKTVDTGNIATYDEDLSMVRPKYEDKPELIATAPARANESRYSNATPPKNANNEIENAIEAMVSKNKAVTQTQGFRIQVFSGNNRSEYEQARAYILQYFPSLETYVSYSQPTYRLKVGDFLTRTEAEKYVSALDARFVGAKIIYDNIDYKKGLLAK